MELLRCCERGKNQNGLILVFHLGNCDPVCMMAIIVSCKVFYSRVLIVNSFLRGS